MDNFVNNSNSYFAVAISIQKYKRHVRIFKKNSKFRGDLKIYEHVS